MTGSSDNNRSQRQGRHREVCGTKEVEQQRHDRRNTNRQRGRVRAMSVRGNAKSNCHRKTHQVEPDGTGRKFRHLTRGDLLCESAGEVSRDRSSVEAVETRWSEGSKNQRKSASHRTPGCRHAGLRHLEGVATAAATFRGDRERHRWITVSDLGVETEFVTWAKGGGRRCSMK